MTDDAQVPFFHRDSVRHQIHDLSRLEDWTIYLGSGATVDRTGLSWPNLVLKLLSKFEPDGSVRDAIAETYGPIRTATLVRSMYEDGRPDPARSFADDLNQFLYTGRRHLAGRLLEFVVSYAIALASRGHSVVLVTPNYDDYLIDLLNTTGQRRVGEGVPGRTVDWQLIAVDQGDVKKDRHDWENYDFATPGRITVVHLHGLEPRAESRFQEKPLERVPVVISESDYSKTYHQVREALIRVFGQRSVLLIGTSVTDPPLVDALNHVRGDGHVRAAVVAARSRTLSRESGHDMALDDWARRRLESLGLDLVSPDFHGQVGQFINELHYWMKSDDPDRIFDGLCDERYGRRLEQWWNDWFTENGVFQTDAAIDGGTVVVQRHYRMLADALPNVRTAIQKNRPGKLKLEFWVRWEPHERQLGLWATTVGILLDNGSRKMAKLDTHEDQYAVNAFRKGAPVITSASQSSNSMWRSHLSVPIWYGHRPGSPSVTGDLQVAVISLSSEDDWNSSAAAKNLENMDRAIVIMKGVGKRLAAPGS